MDRCLCYVCNAEVRDGTFPAVLVCPESSQPIIPLNYLLTRWNWCFWSADWIIRNVGHSYSPWLVSLICPIWSPCFNNLLSCTTYSCWTIIYDLSERHGRCFILLARLAWAGVHGFRSRHHSAFLFSVVPHSLTSTFICRQANASYGDPFPKQPGSEQKNLAAFLSLLSFHNSSPFSLNCLWERVGTGPGRHGEQESARLEWHWLCLL